MFLVDDILLSPIHGLLFVFRELHKAVQQESVNEGLACRTQLSELYMMLETKRISEEEFEAGEKELLDRLDEIQDKDTGSDDEGEAEN